MATTITNERLIEIFEYLKKCGLVTTQKDFAIKIGTKPSAVSSALCGRDAISTQYLMRVNDAFGGLFSLQWLASGTGSMLAGNDETLQAGNDINIDMSTNTNTASDNATIITGDADALERKIYEIEMHALRAERDRLTAELIDAKKTIERLQNALINAINK